jgi:hypothetical protein
MPHAGRPVLFELLRKPFTNQEWVLLGVLQGLTGGTVFMVVDAVWNLVHGEWFMALATPLFLPCAMLAGMVNALVGIPVYRWLVKQLALADKTASTPGDGNAA